MSARNNLTNQTEFVIELRLVFAFTVASESRIQLPMVFIVPVRLRIKSKDKGATRQQRSIIYDGLQAELPEAWRN